MKRWKTWNSRNLNLRGGFCAEGTRVEAYGHSEVSLIRISPLRNAINADIRPTPELEPIIAAVRLNNLHDCCSFVESLEIHFCGLMPHNFHD